MCLISLRTSSVSRVCTVRHVRPSSFVPSPSVRASLRSPQIHFVVRSCQSFSSKPLRRRSCAFWSRCFRLSSSAAFSSFNVVRSITFILASASSTDFRSQALRLSFLTIQCRFEHFTFISSELRRCLAASATDFSIDSLQLFSASIMSMVIVFIRFQRTEQYRQFPSKLRFSNALCVPLTTSPGCLPVNRRCREQELRENESSQQRHCRNKHSNKIHQGVGSSYCASKVLCFLLASLSISIFGIFSVGIFI